MDRKKIMYIGIILIVTVILSVTCFSYAFFTHTSEQRGKLNVVVGTLDYKLECEDLTNNSVTLAANEKKAFDIKITSLNDVNSKYILYYQTNNNEIKVGYVTDLNATPIGTINKGQAKTVTVVVENTTSNSVTVTFGVQGGFIAKEVTLASNQNAIENLYYKITLNANGGSLTDSQIFAEVGNSINLVTPVKTDYSFKGWYLENTYQTQVSSPYTPTSSVTLYAKWDIALKIGDYVMMTPSSTSYTTNTAKTGYSSTQTINPSELDTWRVIRLNDDGTIDMVSEYTSSVELYFKGKTGYMNFVGYLNEVASQYENSDYTIGSRYMGYNGQILYCTSACSNVKEASCTACPTDTGYTVDNGLVQTATGSLIAKNVSDKTTAVAYWIASRKYSYSYSSSDTRPQHWYDQQRYISASGSLSYFGYSWYYSYANSGASAKQCPQSNAVTSGMCTCDGSGYSSLQCKSAYRLRPIVVLKSTVGVSSGAGTSDNPYILSAG